MAPIGDQVTICIAGRSPQQPRANRSQHPIQHARSHELIFDKGSFLELQKGFAGNAIVGFARLAGQPVAIVSQEPADRAGLMDVDASDKIARMVNLADSFNLPIITFVDSPGFLPGVDQEYRGVIRHGAKVLYTYANATVPLISVVTRKAYGGAYVVLSSKFMGTDICYPGASAENRSYGAEGAANILSQANSRIRKPRRQTG